MQVISAIQDNLISYPYRSDTNALTVEVLRGGHPGPLYRIKGHIYGVDIILARPLQAGETASLEYETTFHYRTPPPPEFRRAAVRRIENLELRVEFHREKLPTLVWWAVWDGLDGPIIERESVALDGEQAVHRFLRAIESTVVGFYWEW